MAISGFYTKLETPSIVNVLDEWGDSQDPRVEITVKSICLTCDFSLKWARQPQPWVFNAKSRIMHFTGYDEGKTMCGKDATGESWLWQM